jgi:hypothetical protein
MCLIMSVVFGISGVAMAANNVAMTSDVPNINKSSCGEAGNEYLRMDEGTQMQEGDIIQFTLNNNTSLCKAIDYYVLLADDSSFDISTDTAEIVSTNHVASWFTVYNSVGLIPASTGNNGIDLNGDGSMWDVGLHVHGSNGSQIYTLQLVRRLRSGALNTAQWKLSVNTGARFVVELNNNIVEESAYALYKFFDKKQNDDTYQNPFYEDRDADAKYEDTEDGLSEEADNVLCVDTSVFGGEYIGTTPASIVSDNKYKLSFTGDYYIAHILGEDILVIEEVCEKMVDCNYFELAYAEDQYGNTTPPSDSFDPGDYSAGSGRWSGITSWSSDDTCDVYYGVGAKMYNAGEDFGWDSDWRITLTLYLNGAPASDSILWWGSTTGTLMAGDAVTNVTGDEIYYYDDPFDSDLCNGTAGTAMNPAWRVPVQETGHVSQIYADLAGPVSGGVSFNTYILDWPVVNVDYERLADGDVISAVISWGELPCGGGVDEEFCLVNVIDDCDDLVAPSVACYQLRAPYGLGGSNTAFWTGVAVTNYNTSSDANATITIMDMNGGSGSLDVTIPAQGGYVGTVGQIIAEDDFEDGSTALDPTADCWIKVEANTWIDGIVFVGDLSTSFLHGYLFRSFNSCPTNSRPTSALH